MCVFGVIFSSKKTKVTRYILIFFLLYGFIFLVFYGVIFSQFTSLSLQDKTITISYASLNEVNSKKVIIKGNEIKNMYYKVEWSDNNYCSIAIEAKSGSKYKSGKINLNKVQCKNIIDNIKDEA